MISLDLKILAENFITNMKTGMSLSLYQNLGFKERAEQIAEQYGRLIKPIEKTIEYNNK